MSEVKGKTLLGKIMELTVGVAAGSVGTVEVLLRRDDKTPVLDAISETAAELGDHLQEQVDLIYIRRVHRSARAQTFTKIQIQETERAGYSTEPLGWI